MSNFLAFLKWHKSFLYIYICLEIKHITSKFATVIINLAKKLKIRIAPGNNIVDDDEDDVHVRMT